MKQIQNWENVQENGNSLVPGGYIIQIKKVEDDENDQCLILSYDIVEGEFKDYFTNYWKQYNYWKGTFKRYYRDSAMPFFKRFTNSVLASNYNCKFNPGSPNPNPQDLKGMVVGAILREEEYVAKSGPYAGTIRIALNVYATVDVQKIKSGDFKVPEKKCLSDADKAKYGLATQSSSNGLDITNDNLPF